MLGRGHALLAGARDIRLQDRRGEAHIHKVLQLGVPITTLPTLPPSPKHQAVAFMLADMAVGVESSRLCMYYSAWEVDQGKRNSYFASIAKSLASDVANKSASDAVQVCTPQRLLHWVVE